MNLIFSLLLSITMVNASPAPSPAPESPEDQPWDRIAHELQEKADAKLEKLAPSLSKQIRADSKRAALKALWGESLNYDEFAKAEILDRKILENLGQLFKMPLKPAETRIVHAGMEHTYGYLFSTLKTPYGYKRARWVQGEITAGFGLSPALLSPAPPSGTLFSNVTAFIGRIAFQQNPAQLKALTKADTHVSNEIRNYNFKGLQKVRVIETIDLEPTRTVRLITDLVTFKNAPKDPNKNTTLLVYSVEDSAHGGQRLISAFPVQTKFVEQVTQADRLGNDQPIQSRYNAFVEGLTGTPGRGKREKLILE